MSLVVYFRSTVLTNFRMVVAFLAGFWFLLLMLFIHMLFESVGLAGWLTKIVEGSAKLLAMAMFLGGSYVALLERLNAANAVAQLGLYGERRKRQEPISFPDRRGKIELGPLSEEGELEPLGIPDGPSDASAEEKNSLAAEINTSPLPQEAPAAANNAVASTSAELNIGADDIPPSPSKEVSDPRQSVAAEGKDKSEDVEK